MERRLPSDGRDIPRVQRLRAYLLWGATGRQDVAVLFCLFAICFVFGCTC